MTPEELSPPFLVHQEYQQLWISWAGKIPSEPLSSFTKEVSGRPPSTELNSLGGKEGGIVVECFEEPKASHHLIDIFNPLDIGVKD